MEIDPAGLSSIVASVRWIEEMMVGPLATGVAAIAVAIVGMNMLAGRIDWRRGASVVMGCFVIFSAAAISNGLVEVPKVAATGPSDVALIVVPLAQKPAVDAFDPYGGAAVTFRPSSKDELRGKGFGDAGAASDPLVKPPLPLIR